MLSLLLITLLTHECTAKASTNQLIEFAEFAHTTVVGLIGNDEETGYRVEVEQLVGWSKDNNLSLNVDKAKEIIVNFRSPQQLRWWRGSAAQNSLVSRSLRISP